MTFVVNYIDSDGTEKNRVVQGDTQQEMFGEFGEVYPEGDLQRFIRTEDLHKVLDGWVGGMTRTCSLDDAVFGYKETTVTNVY